MYFYFIFPTQGIMCMPKTIGYQIIVCARCAIPSHELLAISFLETLKTTVTLGCPQEVEGKAL